jgi:flagellar basal-body rod protein FlgC
MSDLFKAMRISGSGLMAEQKRIDVITHNITNANQIDEDGTPYTRQIATFREAFDREVETHRYDLRGVEISNVINDENTPYQTVFDPNSPYANEEGFVTMPNVDMTTEMTDLMIANRAYSANVTAFNSAKAIYQKSLEIGK